jgi:hypothetical protein
MRSLLLTNPSVQVGDKFARLTILGVPFRIRGATGGQRKFVVCECECGTIAAIEFAGIRKGVVKSCGCYNREYIRATKRHGDWKAPLYKSWSAMKARCSNPNNPRWSSYGGRGITVCQEWRDNYEAFRDWSHANGYGPSLVIDREDNDGNYEPSNCRWVTQKVSARNKRVTIRMTAFGETKCVVDWVKDSRCAVSRNALLERLRRGVTPEVALTTGPQPGRSKFKLGSTG